DGTCIRDYIHVDDLAEAHVLAIQAVEPGKALVYNVGTGTGNSVLEVIRTAREVVGRDIPTNMLTRRPGDVDSLVACSKKLQKELGWTPKYKSLYEIIETAWAWHRTHPGGYLTR
ncbi:unnamed protein product, partial [marine sediment metagenome]